MVGLPAGLKKLHPGGMKLGLGLSLAKLKKIQVEQNGGTTKHT